MGEAKRKREAVLNGPCPCGSKKAARFCCFNGKEWHKPAATLGLKTLPRSSSVPKCYMKELGSCVAPISGEHIISESVIRVLMGDGEFSIGGLPWLAPDERKSLAPQSLRTNCLCTKHNSTLHPLDDAAQYFFASLKSYLERDEGMRHALVSGHDVERWLLKTAKAAAVSKNLARGRTPLSGAFSQDSAILDMLDDPRHWPEGAGLYCTMNAGDQMSNHPRFQLQPLTNAQEDIEALALKILGLGFVLLLEPLDVNKYPFLHGAKYRPGRIIISYPTSTCWLTMSWDDGRTHEALTVQYVRAAP
ncbi:hypothetical protein HAP48_0004935 [Bradyrhizobium septentrionale]|nr:MULTISPECIES: hypothetical protein [Bradyrhizobium]UGY16865.1 hypothetical protein HAP48_0004935 [Bradyrhizobium septentrionale]